MRRKINNLKTKNGNGHKNRVKKLNFKRFLKLIKMVNKLKNGFKFLKKAKIKKIDKMKKIILKLFNKNHKIQKLIKYNKVKMLHKNLKK
jgi:hypothetical protein